MSTLPLLIGVLRDPHCMARLGAAEWDLLLRQSQSANLTASLYLIARQEGLLERIAPMGRRHLVWAGTLAARHANGVSWEISRIMAAMAGLATPLILLKGAAYAAAGLPPAQGRLFSDIDILVPRAALPQVESVLMQHGWVAIPHDAYDERYYREWMHEIPPVRHLRRASVIDVHHAILPLTARARPDSGQLRAAAIELPGRPGLQVLAPVDMVLHSATHLFYDGEFDKGLRDLLDLHRLLLHFGASPDFWPQLDARARAMQLGRPLFYALRYSVRVLRTPVPAAVMAAAAQHAPAAPLLALMDQLFGRALRPAHASCDDGFSALARFALYLRGNWLRMPPLMLARHLFHKAFISPREDKV